MLGSSFKGIILSSTLSVDSLFSVPSASSCVVEFFHVESCFGDCGSSG
jgi:hypothetical protein